MKYCCGMRLDSNRILIALVQLHKWKVKWIFRTFKFTEFNWSCWLKPFECFMWSHPFKLKFLRWIIRPGWNVVCIVLVPYMNDQVFKQRVTCFAKMWWAFFVVGLPNSVVVFFSAARKRRDMEIPSCLSALSQILI